MKLGRSFWIFWTYGIKGWTYVVQFLLPGNCGIQGAHQENRVEIYHIIQSTSIFGTVVMSQWRRELDGQYAWMRPLALLAGPLPPEARVALFERATVDQGSSILESQGCGVCN